MHRPECKDSVPRIVVFQKRRETISSRRKLDARLDTWAERRFWVGEAGMGKLFCGNGFGLVGQAGDLNPRPPEPHSGGRPFDPRSALPKTSKSGRQTLIAVRRLPKEE